MTLPNVITTVWPQTVARLPRFLLIDTVTSRNRQLYCRRNGHMHSLLGDRCLWCGLETP